jgi:pantoate--beta-alanine ligase
MIILDKRDILQDTLVKLKYKNNIKIGFVPTMGFLHQGHTSLVKKSISENNITVCSIFVNPLQFNEQKDFDSYPRDFQKDISMLEALKCDIVYIPDYKDIYPPTHKVREYDFQQLEQTMEGVHRKGHFQGVAEVVRILFEHVQPNTAYFGEKDFQQLLIVKALVKQLRIPVEIIGCPIIREQNGLAMSSRNSLLTVKAREKSGFIWQQLRFCTEQYQNYSPSQLQDIIKHNFSKQTDFELIYLEVVNRETLCPIQRWDEAAETGVFCAARIEGVRLIDNIKLY